MDTFPTGWTKTTKTADLLSFGGFGLLCWKRVHKTAQVQQFFLHVHKTAKVHSFMNTKYEDEFR